jgi:single-stranded-DNA-specific exonuclease
MHWTLKTAPNVPLVDELSEVLSIDKVLSSLLIQRGVHTFEQAKKFFSPIIR